MAFTVSTVTKGVSDGNMIRNVLRVTADAATGTVESGLRLMSYAQVTSVSAPTQPNIMLNANASNVAANGTLGMSNCTSGNIYLVVAFGN